VPNNRLDSSSRFDRTPTCDRQTETLCLVLAALINSVVLYRDANSDCNLGLVIPIAGFGIEDSVSL